MEIMTLRPCTSVERERVRKLSGLVKVPGIHVI